MLISASAPRRIGVPEAVAPLRVGSYPQDTDVETRHVFLAGEPAFELSFWCGTCPFLFTRQGGANGTLSQEAPVLDVLEEPLESVDEGVVHAFSELVGEGDYLVLLQELRPQAVTPHHDRDYFAHEQVATWGIDAFWGLPENPRSHYYRTHETAVDADSHLYEFVVPMVPPTWNDRERVEHYREAMGRGRTPTAVSLSTLDVCEPATATGPDPYAHWGLTHFLLDGHHKLEAAASSGSAVRLLSLVSIDGSLAQPDQVRRLPELLARPPAARR